MYLKKMGGAGESHQSSIPQYKTSQSLGSKNPISILVSRGVLRDWWKIIILKSLDAGFLTGVDTWYPWLERT